MARRSARPVLCLVAVLLGTSSAWAVDKTWTGTTSTTWSTGSNWTPAGAPGVNDRAIINNVANDPVVTGNATVAQLVVNAGGILTINNGVTLTVANTTVSPLIDGTGTVAGAGLLQVTNAPNTGAAVLFNDSITIAAFTLNGPANALAFNIPSGRTVTCNGAFTLTRSTLNVGAAAGAASTLHVNGAVNVQTNGTLNMRAPASILRVSGTLTLTGGWTAGTSTLFLDPTANQTLSITTGAPRQFWDVTILTDGGGNQVDADLVTPSAAMTINNNLTITRGQFQVGNFTVIVGGNLVSGTTAQSQFDFTSTGTLRARGNVDIASLSQITTQVTGPFATIIMDGTVPQTFQLRAPSNTQYHDIDHFQVSNPAGVTVLDNPGADFTVNGQLTIDANCTLTVRDVFDPESPLTMGANSLLRLENVIRQDSTIVGSTFTAGAGSTVVYAGQGINQTVYAQQGGGQQIQYQNLTIDNNGGAVASHQNSGDLMVNGTFTILGATSSFTAVGNRTLTVRQSFIDNGTFTHGNGTVVMAGTGSIGGTAASLVFSDLFISGALATDSVTAQRSFTTADTFQVNQGALTTSGNITITANAGMLVGNGAGAAGTADLNLVGPSTLQINSGQSLTVSGTDGRITSVVGGGANPTLTRAGAGTFTATVSGQANLFGLNFSFGNAVGLNFAASATIERLRNVRFTNVAAGAGSRHLSITSGGLDLDAPGCMFDTVAANQFNVFAFDNNAGNGIPVRLRFELRTASNAAGAIGGPGAGDNFDGDDDTNANGVIAAPEVVSATFGGSIVQWPYTANIDMAGAIQGFPMPAFDWNNFAYYSTYVLMQNTAAFDTIYVLNTDGDVKAYSFVLAAAGARIVGPIFWDTEGANRVVYFGTSTGQVHKLIDTGASLVAAGGSWATPFQLGGAGPSITSPVVSDRTNVYFGALSGGTHGIYAVTSGTKALVPGSPCPTGGDRPATAPSWVVAPGGTHLYWGSLAVAGASRLYRVRTGNWGVIDAQFNSGSATPPAPPDVAPMNTDCTADFLASTNVTDSAVSSTPYLYAGEMNGYMHAANAVGTFTTVRPGFPFRDGTSAIRGGAVVDWFTGRLFFGNAAGSIYTLGNSAGAWTLGTNYFRFATGGGAVQSMPLYQSGVLYVSNVNGNLYALDVSAQALVRTWNLGITAATNDVGDVSRDATTGRIYVGTSGGRLYSVPAENDPTATP